MFYYLLAGLLIGVVGTLLLSKRKSYGTVIVYFPEDPAEPPYLGFQHNNNTYGISNQKRVEFDVKVEYLNSQK